MPTLTNIPDWETYADHLHSSLGYTDVTLERTKYTYNIFVGQFCGTDGDAETRIEQGIEQIGNAFESRKISKDKLLRLRRVAYRMLQIIKNGEVTWKRILVAVIRCFIRFIAGKPEPGQLHSQKCSNLTITFPILLQDEKLGS